MAESEDLAGALLQVARAHERGPHWADPLKAAGDVLARQGHRAEALTRYDEALKWAPRWQALAAARATLSPTGHAG